MPLDCRILVNTPRQTKINNLLNGEYVHFELKNTLESLLIKQSAELPKELLLSFNVDGLPLFHSSNLQFWPILGFIRNLNYGPFAIGIFCGTSKPNTLGTFLEDFITKLNFLQQNGITVNSDKYVIKVLNFICDAPARAYIKCVKPHGSYSSCEKCITYGEYINGRVTLPECNANLRTDILSTSKLMKIIIQVYLHY